MTSSNRIIVSRRSLIQIASAGAGALIASFAAVPAHASDAAVSANGMGVPADRSSGRHDPLPDEYILLDAVEREYGEAVATFPFSLPEGVSFPKRSGLHEPEQGTWWQAGSGFTAAFMFWMGAVSRAAVGAHLRGDDVTADHYLDQLEAGYKSDTRAAVIDDASNAFVDHAISPARAAAVRGRSGSRSRDFTALHAALGS